MQEKERKKEVREGKRIIKERGRERRRQEMKRGREWKRGGKKKKKEEREEKGVKRTLEGGRGGGICVKKAEYLGKGNKYRKMVAREGTRTHMKKPPPRQKKRGCQRRKK